MNRVVRWRICPFACGFLAANLAAGTTVAVAARGLPQAQSVGALSCTSCVVLLICALPCSLIGGVVAGYCEGIVARKNGYLAKPWLLATAVILFNAGFVEVALGTGLGVRGWYAVAGACLMAISLLLLVFRDFGFE